MEGTNFLYDTVNAADNLISGSSFSSKPSLDIWKFLVHILLKPSMQDFKHDLTSMGDACISYFTPSSLRFLFQFVLFHTVKGFGIVNKSEVDVFLEFLSFLYDPANVGNLILGSSSFSRYPVWISGSFWFA